MTGKFSFTSPSVYLAYDTVSGYVYPVSVCRKLITVQISASGKCKHPGSLLTNGILTLHPSELSSVVSSFTACPKSWDSTAVCTFKTMRNFNLLDLHGPVPANAYFQGRKSLFTSSALGEYEPECSSAICENKYYPTIALPWQVVKSEPAFASCFPFYDGNEESLFLTSNTKTKTPLIQGYVHTSALSITFKSNRG